MPVYSSSSNGTNGCGDGGGAEHVFNFSPQRASLSEPSFGKFYILAWLTVPPMAHRKLNVSLTFRRENKIFIGSRLSCQRKMLLGK